jgi:N6-adenosine-specific RNA methylase IME4
MTGIDTNLDLTALKPHPYADLFPMMQDGDFDALAADIARVGLQERIIILDGMILDGRNRYKALLRNGSGITRRSFEWFENLQALTGSRISPLDFVISKNMARRHLTESQRAMAASAVANMRQGERTDLRDKAPIDDTEHSANLQKVSTKEAAGLFNVSERMVASAKKVRKKGSEKLQELVNSGKVPVSVADGLVDLEQAEQDKAIDSHKPEQLKTVVKKVKRLNRQKKLAEKQLALPVKKYGVIYADPEWRFEVRSAQGLDRAADNHYPTSELAEIMARPVADIAADDCVLFLWATVPMLIEALCVIDAWGFAVIKRDKVSGFLMPDKRAARYVSSWTWVKSKVSTGYWARNQHEILLIATRGDPVAPAMGEQPASVFNAPVGAHSVKPDVFAEWIERLFPDIPKIELNARRARPGWEIWGNEAPEAPASAPEAGDKAAKVVFVGKHTDATDAVIKRGYEAGKTILEITLELGLDKSKKGIVKGRASRLGLTSMERLEAWRKSAKKGK